MVDAMILINQQNKYLRRVSKHKEPEQQDDRGTIESMYMYI